MLSGEFSSTAVRMKWTPISKSHEKERKARILRRIHTHRPNYGIILLWSAKKKWSSTRKKNQEKPCEVQYTYRYWRCKEEEETDEKFRAVVSVWKLNANSIHFILFCCCLFSIVGQEIGCWRERSRSSVDVCVCVLLAFHLLSSMDFSSHCAPVVESFLLPYISSFLFRFYFIFLSLIHSFFLSFFSLRSHLVCKCARAHKHTNTYKARSSSQHCLIKS